MSAFFSLAAARILRRKQKPRHLAEAEQRRFSACLAVDGEPLNDASALARAFGAGFRAPTRKGGRAGQLGENHRSAFSLAAFVCALTSQGETVAVNRFVFALSYSPHANEKWFVLE